MYWEVAGNHMQAVHNAGQIYPPYRSHWGHKITDFMLLAFYSFIITFTVFTAVLGSNSKPNSRSRESLSGLPPGPPMVQTGN